jgi:hypothetical protein
LNPALISLYQRGPVFPFFPGILRKPEDHWLHWCVASSWRVSERFRNPEELSSIAVVRGREAGILKC